MYQEFPHLQRKPLKFLRRKFSDMAEADIVEAAIPATIPEKENSQLSHKTQSEQDREDADPYRSPRKPVKVSQDNEAPAVVDDWHVITVLSRIPILQYMIDSVVPVHQRLKATNWIYLTAYVYVGCVACFFYRFATFPLVNLQVTRLLDRVISFLLEKIVDRVPLLWEPFEPQLSLPEYIHDVLHPDVDNRLPVRVLAKMTLLWLRIYHMIMKAVLFVTQNYSSTALSIHAFINESFLLKDVPFDRLPVALAALLLAPIWRTPYNLLYSWALHPLLIQPTIALQNISDALDIVLDNEPTDSEEQGYDVPQNEEQAEQAVPEQVHDAPAADNDAISNGSPSPLQAPIHVPAEVHHEASPPNGDDVVMHDAQPESPREEHL